MHRNWLRIKGYLSITIFTIISQIVIELIVSSVFCNLGPGTCSFYPRTAALFFATLFNAFGTLLEMKHVQLLRNTKLMRYTVHLRMFLPL